MMTWYSGNGWGWCSMVGNVPVMVLLWGGAFTAIVLAVYLALRRSSDPPIPTWRAESTRAEGVVAARHAGGETDNDEFFRRLM